MLGFGMRVGKVAHFVDNIGAIADYARAADRGRVSAKTSSKTIARDAERHRRRELELGINRIEQPKRMPLFKLAAEQWLANLSGLAEKSLAAYRQ